MDEHLKQWNCAVVHVGVNCADAGEAERLAQFLSDCFGISPERNSDASVFAGPFVELMKQSGRGRHGHIAVATDDILATRAYLESIGCAFDDTGNKYFPDGSLLLTYLDYDFAGFAIHLLQRSK